LRKLSVLPGDTVGGGGQVREGGRLGLLVFNLNFTGPDDFLTIILPKVFKLFPHTKVFASVANRSHAAILILSHR
jgi:hypothetical protein